MTECYIQMAELAHRIPVCKPGIADQIKEVLKRSFTAEERKISKSYPRYYSFISTYTIPANEN